MKIPLPIATVIAWSSLPADTSIPSSRGGCAIAALRTYANRMRHFIRPAPRRTAFLYHREVFKFSFKLLMLQVDASMADLAVLVTEQQHIYDCAQLHENLFAHRGSFKRA